MSDEVGLRERKKRETRERIAGAAWRLFTERGFDRVTVGEVAASADVSEATVFNYFPRKEDLVFDRLAAFVEGTLATIRARPAAEPLVEAFARSVVEPAGLLGRHDETSRSELEATIRLITASPALLACERELFDEYVTRLAALVAEERGVAASDIEAVVEAAALVGLHRALVEDVRRRVLAGESSLAIGDAIRESGRRGVALLERGLTER